MPKPADLDLIRCEIGRVIRVWASLEGLLWHWVGLLLQVDQFRARAVWASLPTGRARREFLRRLAETYLDAGDLVEFRKLLRRTKSLSEHRNMLAHSLLLESDRADRLTFVDDKEFNEGEFNFISQKSITVSNLSHWVKDGEALIKEYMELGSRAKVHALPRMHREPPEHRP